MVSRLISNPISQPRVEVWLIRDDQPVQTLDLGNLSIETNKRYILRFRPVGGSINNLVIGKIDNLPSWLTITAKGQSLAKKDVAVRNRSGGTMIPERDWSEDIPLEIEVGSDGDAGSYRLELVLKYQAP